MFKNYFKTSLRSMIRNPLSSFINIFGLSVAIGMTLVVYTMIEFSSSLDKYHENAHEVFLTTFYADRDGKEAQYGTTPLPMAEMLKNDFSQIEKVARVQDFSVIVKREDDVFHERVRAIDPTFLEMLTFPLKWGTPSSLADINSIVLSSEMAIKYFGYDNPVGQELLVKFSDEKKKIFSVVGVAEEFPNTHAISFDFLINFENLKFVQPDYHPLDWNNFISATLIQVSNPSDIEIIKSQTNKYKKLQNEMENDWKIIGFNFHDLYSLHENSSQIVNDISRDQAKEVFIGLPVMGAFMLALACFNYINMAIGSATKRLKEIGVRKVIGANRSKVIVQFLAENLLMTFFATLMGLFLTITVFLPWFTSIADAPLEISLININMWIYLITILIFTGVVSGIYPALYVSKFRVVHIFRGAVKFGKRNPIMKAFLCLQMILAFVFITMAVMFNENSNYQAQREWGYNQHGALYLELPEKAAFDQFKGLMDQNPNIISVSGARDHVGKTISETMVHINDNAYTVQQLSVASNYFTTLEIDFSQGSSFTDRSTNNKTAIVNETFLKNTQLQDPIGAIFKLDSTQYQIIGVVNDFHAFNFYNKIDPIVFLVSEKEDYRFISMRVRAGSEMDVYEDLKGYWADLYPETPFQGGQQIDLWAKFYADLGQMKRFTRTIASVAILLAALGLYGLVTLNVSGRIKEFSIRKVLGAGLKNLTSSVTRQYIVLTVVAFVIGAPLAYMLNLGLVEMMFAYPLPAGYWGVGIAFVILVIVMLGVFSTQVRRVFVYNPAQGLRSE